MAKKHEGDSARPSRKMTRRALLQAAAAGAAGLAIPPVRAALPKPKDAHPPLPPLPVDRVRPLVANRATAFDLADVRLLPGRFLDAQARDGAYLLFLEPDRLLHNFLVNAGLTPKAAIYGGWESEGVAGHIGGHYLSACSLMYRATGDARYRQRVDYMVSELARCQRQASDGLVTAIPDARTIFQKIAADGTVTGWVPWYTMHKLYAGLRDAHLYCGNATAKDVFLRLSDWAIALTANLTDDQFQAMLATEHGGMAETLADAYALTGDAKYLALAHRFTHHAVFDPLARREDRLDGLHSNTQIPKMIGYARIAELTGEPPYHTAPLFFWQTVVGNRSYVNGGNGDYEHFFPVSQFRDHVDSDCATETCCTYNMLKLTRAEFQKDPAPHYADYAERALYNDILASQAPDSGMMAYFSPIKPGHFKVYNDPVNAFWCCVGTGLENHTKYGDSIYFHGDDGRALYVNLFIPSVLNWRTQGVTVTQQTRFPEEETTRLTLTCAKPSRLALKVRCPSWTSGLTASVNGKPVGVAAKPGAYVTLERTWHHGDTVEFRMPMALRMEPLPNAPEKQAVMVGPILLAASMGTDGMTPKSDINGNQAPFDQRPALDPPVFVAEPAELLSKIRPVHGQPLRFRTVGLGQPQDVTLKPYFETHHERYNMYWGVYTPEAWAQHKTQLAEGEAAARALDARTVDEFRPGDQQSEVDHHLQGENSRTGSFNNRAWRDAANGWFSFTLKAGPTAPVALLCTYWGSDAGGRAFDILVDGTLVGSQTLVGSKPGRFFDVTYPIPAALTAGKSAVTVKIQAKPGMLAGGLFGCRMVRQQAALPKTDT